MGMMSHTTCMPSTCITWKGWKTKSWQWDLECSLPSALALVFRFTLSYSNKRRLLLLELFCATCFGRISGTCFGGRIAIRFAIHPLEWSGPVSSFIFLFVLLFIIPFPPKEIGCFFVHKIYNKLANYMAQKNHIWASNFSFFSVWSLLFQSMSENSPPK